ncbi:NAD(P)/FAD-dependent oxidoreductase [Parvularcula sp. IMCC14364]|uniref:NAD(P)/FAD-dependent oxidoreductase n=1 Tax=Parvularcula sp. IMCC14364 TaxID=3067902 RepID=UPI00274178EE|nr:FAD-dependent oxidoreductase [Parvularcula sp. IMCC14364]
MRIAIIGAGISGITAARELSNYAEVVIFEKSRGVGGRMSTRYAGVHEFDHGAQYFTASTEEFLSVVSSMIDQEIVQRWPARAQYLKSGSYEKDTGKDRFVGTPRMNQVPKFLARDLNINTEHRVLRIEKVNNSWILSFDDQQASDPFDWLVIAIPAPQATTLLTGNKVLQSLGDVRMNACFSLMLGFDKSIDVGWDTLRVDHDPVSWIAVNSAKPGRHKQYGTLVVQTSETWSNRHQEYDLPWIQSSLETVTSSLTGLNVATAPFRKLHRWLYASNANTPHGVPVSVPEDQIGICGDWREGGRVEGAFLSGRRIAHEIIKHIR